MDFTAVKSSSDHLRKTLQWGGWPPAAMTLDDNRFALENHWAEFENHKAYAYTVLAPDKQPCLGCVYLNPSNQGETGLSVIFWVRADQLTDNLDIHVVEILLAHIRDAWPVDFVEFPIPVQNQRGLEILKKIGLEIGEQSDRETTYLWRRFPP